MGQQNLQPDHEDQLVNLGRALQALREEENADVLIQTTLDYLKEEFKYRLIWIGLYDRLEHLLVGKGGITPNADTTLLKQRYNLYPGDLLEQVVIQQRPVGIPDLRQEIRAGAWRRAAQEYGIQGTLLFPLRCKDRCFGLVLLGSPLWGVSPRPAEKAHLSLVLGGLAAALHKLELEWQRRSVKRPDQALFGMIDRLRQFPTLALRLETVVTMTQEFIASSRTNIYWYCAEQRYFWHRLGSRQSLRRYGQAKSQIPGLRVSEVNDFYQALAAGQLVAIGTARSLLSSQSTQRLLARLQIRSLLAAPIQADGELLGFLAVEDNQARIWEESERNYISATAQLVGLLASQEDKDVKLQETAKDAHFAAEIAQIIAKHCPLLPMPGTGMSAALQECATLLCGRLEATLFLVLQEAENGQFNLVFQPPSLKRLPVTVFAPLNPNDRKLIIASSEAVMIEDLQQDLRLMEWRRVLGQLGGRSLLISKTQLAVVTEQGRSDDSKLSLLIVGYDTPRTWSYRARELASVVAHQIHLLLLVQRYGDYAQQSFQLYQVLQDGLAMLQSAELDPVLLERSWIDYLASKLECPLTALFSWTAESEYATVAAAVVSDPRFAFAPSLAIQIDNNPLIQEVLANEGWLFRSVTDLPEAIAQWLINLGLSQVLLMALHTDAPTTSFILLALDESDLPQHLLMAIATLNQQFAWFRQYRYSLYQHAQDQQMLQTLNWYKQRCLGTLHQSVTQSLCALLDQATMPMPQSNQQRLAAMRRKQLLQQLQETLAILTPVLKDELWQLHNHHDSTSLAGLLKRSLGHVEPLFDHHKIRLQVHNSHDKNVYGDLLKLECILYELLVTICLGAQPGSRINLWCCPASSVDVSSQLELLIVENASLEECLQVNYFQQLPLCTNLEACQYLLQSWGGDLQFCQLADQYSLIRLTLPQ
ncbi:MAG: GAF domain-containing protein [Coleofasciculaceae cyanobacterium]